MSISMQSVDMAQDEMVDRLNHAVPLIAALDKLLEAPAAPPEELTNLAISQRMGAILDRIVTASVQRLPTDFQRHSVNARIIRESYAQAGERWTQARTQIMDRIHGLRGVVADLAHAYYQGHDLALSQLSSKNGVADIRAHRSNLDEAEAVLCTASERLNALYQDVLPLINSARRVIDEIERLRAAMSILEVPVPEDIHEQLAQWTERLRSYLLGLGDDFAELPSYVRDSTFVDTLQEIQTLCARVDHLLNPIRPSVFAADRRWAGSAWKSDWMRVSIDSCASRGMPSVSLACLVRVRRRPVPINLRTSRSCRGTSGGRAGRRRR
jgi:hypothetical protein